jgi:HTH-type transcriptional regulator/antitoxin HipB
MFSFHDLRLMFPYCDMTGVEAAMATVRSTRDIGAAIRAAREEQRLTQANLAAVAGVSRRWLIAIEQGDHSRAELDRVLRVLDVLKLDVHIGAHGRTRPAPRPATDDFDLDAHVAAFREVT